MNEELQKEIISILRSMKEGSPEAFNFIVEQRSLYCWSHVALSILLFIGSAIFFFICLRFLGKPHKEEIYAHVFTVITGSASFVMFLGGIIHMEYISEAIAPLGRVLEALR